MYSLFVVTIVIYINTSIFLSVLRPYAILNLGQCTDGFIRGRLKPMTWSQSFEWYECVLMMTMTVRTTLIFRTGQNEVAGIFNVNWGHVRKGEK